MFLKKAFICVGEVAITGYDDVVQNRQIKELSGFLAFVGNQVVVGRGPGGTRRVIVRKDDCRGIDLFFQPWARMPRRKNE